MFDCDDVCKILIVWDDSINSLDQSIKPLNEQLNSFVVKDINQLTQILADNNLKSTFCGLAKIPNIKDCYHLFYNDNNQYQGISRKNANEVCLSSIEKEDEPIALLYFNLDGYSSYCKRHKEYWSWVSKRNDARYKSTISHDKNYDAKNMMHTFRLLHMAKEIGE